MKNITKIFSLLILLLLTLPSFAQVGYNPLSIRPILEDDIMYRKRVERRINLNEKQNLPFFATQKQITDIILDGVNSGELQPYEANGISADSVVPKFQLSPAQWKASLSGDGTSDTIQFGKDIAVLDIVEEYVFDKRRSRMYIDILTLKLVVPPVTGGQNPLRREIAQFKFKDLHAYFIKVYNRSNQTKAYWFNPKNDRRKMCFSDAFDLRLFSSRITKISNPGDDLLQVTFPGCGGRTVGVEL